MNTGHSILLIAIASGITFLIRAFPFLVFKKRQMPAFLKEIADKLPPAIIAVLVIYCLKGPLTVLGTETIAAVIAIAGVVILHLWKRNTLLSVAARNCSVYDFYSMPSIMRLATNTPLADAWDSECVTPLPSPMIYNPLCRVSRFSSIETSML